MRIYINAVDFEKSKLCMCIYRNIKQSYSKQSYSKHTANSLMFKVSDRKQCTYIMCPSA